jgi:hypothetical protein
MSCTRNGSSDRSVADQRQSETKNGRGLGLLRAEPAQRVTKVVSISARPPDNGVSMIPLSAPGATSRRATAAGVRRLDGMTA